MKALILALALLFSFTAKAQLNTIQLTTANTVVFRGVVDRGSVNKAILELVELSKVRGRSPYPIYLVLDSPGGSIAAGDSFIEFAKTIRDLHTISIFSASMSSAIGQSLPGKRYVTQNGIQMFHRAQGGFEGQFETGELESQLELWKKIVRNMESRNALRVGLSLEAYKAKVVNEWWLYGNDNIEQNAADAIVSLECSQQLIEKRTVSVQQSFFGSLNLTYSNCPLIRGALAASGDEEALKIFNKNQILKPGVTK